MWNKDENSGLGRFSFSELADVLDDGNDKVMETWNGGVSDGDLAVAIEMYELDAERRKERTLKDPLGILTEIVPIYNARKNTKNGVKRSDGERVGRPWWSYRSYARHGDWNGTKGRKGGPVYRRRGMRRGGKVMAKSVEEVESENFRRLFPRWTLYDYDIDEMNRRIRESRRVTERMKRDEEEDAEDILEFCLPTPYGGN